MGEGSGTCPEYQMKTGRSLKFDSHFKVRKNVIFERACFNRKKQEKGDSVELFITALHQAADNCEYGEMRDQMIRDRLVVGILDRSLSERLQMEPDLTPEKTKKLIRQREAFKEQEAHLKSAISEQPRLEELKSQPKNKRFNKRHRHKKQAPGQQPSPGKCEELYLDSAQTGEGGKVWKIQVAVNDKPVTFKVDMGAEVTAISEKTWKALPTTATLSKPTKTLCGPDRKPLCLLGEAEVRLRTQTHDCTQIIFVLKGNNLLGLPAVRALNVLKQVEGVQSETVVQQFPTLFKGLGTFKTEYKIRLKPDAVPFAIHNPRRVALPQRAEVEKELHRMQ